MLTGMDRQGPCVRRPFFYVCPPSLSDSGLFVEGKDLPQNPASLGKKIPEVSEFSGCILDREPSKRLSQWRRFNQAFGTFS